MRRPASTALALAASAASTLLLSPGRAQAMTGYQFVRTDYPTKIEQPIGLYPGDFDEDGRPDVVAAAWDDQAVVMRNTGAGFAALTPVTVGFNLLIFWASALDYDGDGHLDAVTANLNTDFITILQGDGKGNLSHLVDLPTGQAPIHVNRGDIDGDGRPDLVVCNSARPFLTAYLATGVRQDIALPFEESHNTVLRDFDEDGDLDIAVSFSDSNGTVGLLLNLGSGVFGAMTTLGTNLGYHCDSGDFDGDGHFDLVVAPLYTTDVWMLLGNGKGAFQTSSIDTVASFQNDVRVSDLDCDGLDDAVVIGEDESLLYSGSKGVGLVFNRTLATGPASDTVAMADYDGDGITDLAFPELQTPGSVALLMNTTVILHCPPDQTIDPGPSCIVDAAASTCDNTLIITSVPALPAALPLGPNIVTWTAMDPDGRQASCSAILTVIDTTPPVITDVPPDETLECPATPPSASPGWIDCDPDTTLELVETQTPGTCPGDYDLERVWTATDTSGNSSQATQHVEVRDTTPPELPGSARELGCLWPPNHWYVCLTAEELGFSARDSCSEPVTIRIQDCISDQPDEAPDPRWPGWNGDGNTRRDCVVPPDGLSVCMRSERAGTGPTAQDGRHYSIRLVAEDACGNVSAPLEAGWIHVPHDQSPAEKGCFDPTKRGSRPNE